MSQDIFFENSKIDVVGIDVQNEGVVLSYLSDTGNDPATITKEGEETSLLIPLVLAKEVGLGRWYVGLNAKARVGYEGATKIEDIFNSAYEKKTIIIEEKIYSCEELLATYFKRVIEEYGFDLSKLKKIVISVPEVDVRMVELFATLSSKMGLKKDVLTLIDHKESFIYYTLNQNQNIFAHDVVLFDCEKNKVISYVLSRDITTKPQMIDIAVDKCELSENRDADFLLLIERVLKERVVTSVFLTGSGFLEDWMDESVKALVKGRRVFLGDNLYSKGACFVGKIRLNKRPWNFVYIGDHEMKMNLSLKVNDKNEMSFVTLVEAGENWYETGRVCEVILDGTPEFECWIQSPETRKSRIQMIELKEMPKRENRTTRLRILAKPISDTKVSVTIMDLGFGDIAPKTTKSWEHIIDMEES